jgi:transposase
MSAINQIVQREAKTKKQRWIQELVARRGRSCDAVALANKNVCTAYVMLTQ